MRGQKNIKLYRKYYRFEMLSILSPPLCRLQFINYRLYLLTPWSRALLEKLTDSQLVKKLSAFYGTRKFITAFTRVLIDYSPI